MHVAIFGGTGFLGSHIVVNALRAGLTVSVVSRNPPRQRQAGAEYVEADIFDANSYAGVLERADGVVHCIGSIMNQPAYKSLTNEPLCPSTLLKLARLRFAGSNPLESSSFARLNFESAKFLANIVSQTSRHRQPDGGHSVRVPFVYISAENWNRLADAEYISSKRRAEQAIGAHSDLRGVYIRPGFMYDANASTGPWPTLRTSISAGLQLWESVGGESARISVQTVSEAAVEALQDGDIHGVVSNASLRQFAHLNVS